MSTPVVVDCVRTPVGRAHKNRGVFRNIRADDLAVTVVRALLDRTGIAPAEIEDLVLGNSRQIEEQGLNLGRIVSLLAGLPPSVAGATVNRLCGSSLQALNQAAHSIAAEAEDVQIVAGVEHMQHIPMDMGAHANPRLFTCTSPDVLNMGRTAETLAETYGISRERQDRFAVASHLKAAAAQALGEFRAEMVAVAGHDQRDNPILVGEDQCVRPDTCFETLSLLQPAFVRGTGTVTAGNSSPLNDGAAALLVMSQERATSLGLTPLVRIVSTAVVGVDPLLMGTGPVPAVRKALQRAGMSLSNVDLFEINEAFAAQTLACAQILEIDEAKLNVRGGAIAIGHPLGASGARIATTLIHAMISRNANVGLATMCIGVGQGIATVFERV